MIALYCKYIRFGEYVFHVCVWTLSRNWRSVRNLTIHVEAHIQKHIFEIEGSCPRVADIGVVLVIQESMLQAKK